MLKNSRRDEGGGAAPPPVNDYEDSILNMIRTHVQTAQGGFAGGSPATCKLLRNVVIVDEDSP